jgi:hypothetical protein
MERDYAVKLFKYKQFITIFILCVDGANIFKEYVEFGHGINVNFITYCPSKSELSYCGLTLQMDTI